MMKKIFILLLLLFISLTSFSQRAAEFKNGITIQKEEVLASKFVSYGESYITNWRDLVLDDGATYFPNNGGYEIGRLHQAEINTSLHFIPAAVGEGVLYSLGENRTNDFNVDRASFATFVGHGGIITTADFHVARIDYTDGDGAILAEDESINLIERSETFDHGSGYWILSATTLTSGQSAPDGSTNAYKLVEDGANSQHSIVPSASASAIYTMSVYAKGSDRVIQLASTSTGGHYANFDLSDGTIGNSGGTTENVTITQIVDGWYRCSMTTTSNMTTMIIALVESKVSGYHQTYQGDGTSGVYIFGAQLEQQSYASSYIKSDSGTSTTRLADVITGAGDSSTFNSEEGVLFVEMAALVDDGSRATRYISLSDGTNDNRINIGFSSIENVLIIWVDVGGVNQVNSMSSIIINQTDNLKIALKYSLNDYACWVDGVEVFTDNSASVPSVGTINTLQLANGDGSGLLMEGKIKQLKVYKSIADAQKDLPYITNFFPLLLIGFRRRNQYKIAA